MRIGEGWRGLARVGEGLEVVLKTGQLLGTQGLMSPRLSINHNVTLIDNEGRMAPDNGDKTAEGMPDAEILAAKEDLTKLVKALERQPEEGWHDLPSSALIKMRDNLNKLQELYEDLGICLSPETRILFERHLNCIDKKLAEQERAVGAN